MASIWKGSLTFGLVSVPVELKTAVREDHVSFRLLHEKDLSPVNYERICKTDGKPVPWDEIVKGYEYEKGKFVVMSDEDFKTAALESSKTIDVMDFVKDDEIDPRYFETPYYLVPGKGGDKAYALLREAIRATSSIGIGKIIIRQKQHVVAVKVIGDAMVLELMRFQNELVDTSEYTFPSAAGVRPQELKMAEQLIGNLAEPFDPSKYTDEYRANLMKVIRAKMKGKKATLHERDAEPADAKVLDLMERLKQSIDQGAKRGAAKAARKAPAKPKKKRVKRSA
jgi:DNA end-binding protein Ku